MEALKERKIRNAKNTFKPQIYKEIFMRKTLNFLPYIVISSIVVLLTVMLLSRIMPTAEVVKPAAEVMIKNLGL